MERYFVVLICVILFYGCEDNTPVKGVYPSLGQASWYNPERTASGERYHKNEFTCAMRKRDFGKYYLVCNLENNKCLVARHNDFGPAHYLFRKGKIIDLSRYAFSELGDVKKGVIRVRIGEIRPGQAD